MRTTVTVTWIRAAEAEDGEKSLRDPIHFYDLELLYMLLYEI